MIQSLRKLRILVVAIGFATLINLGCAKVDSNQPLVNTQDNTLEGSWGIVSVEREGEPLLFARGTLQHSYIRNIVRMIVGKKVEAESRFIINRVADPLQYDVIAGGRTEQGIFRLEKDVLTICSATAPRSRPDAFTTSNGDGRTLMVFRRMHLDKLGQAVSQSEADDYAKRLESAAKKGDADQVNALIDFEGVCERVTQGLGISESHRLSFLLGMKSNTQVLSGGSKSYGVRIVKSVGDGGRFRSLRVNSEGGSWRVLCRLVSAEDGLGYFEFVLGRDPFGNTAATDLITDDAGTYLSEHLRRIALPTLLKLSPTNLQSLSVRDQDYIRNGDQIRKFLSQSQAGEFESADRTFQQLPESFRSETWLMVTHLKTSSNEDWPGVLKECLSVHPQVPTFQLLAINDAIDRADKEQALEFISRLEQHVGNDPYLDLLRAKACESVGDLDGSRRFTVQATDADPELLGFATKTPTP